MEEKRTGGGKEFIFSVIWAIVLLLVGKGIINAMPDYKMFGMVLTIVMFCVLGFLVMTRYAAIFTYSIKNDRIRVNRQIGHRNKEVDFAISDVKSVTRQRPVKQPKNVQTMKTTVFSQKDVWYVIYEKNRTENMLVCQLSKGMADKLRSRAKNNKNK